MASRSKAGTGGSSRVRGGVGTDASSSSRSIGTDTKTGPHGGVAASRKARRSRVGTSALLRASTATLLAALASPTRSPESIGSWIRWRLSCWPASTTIGVRERSALSIPISPLAVPAATCRLTKEVRPVALA